MGDDIGNWLSTLFTPDAPTDAGSSSGWGELLTGLSEGARGIMEGIAEGAKMISGIDISPGAAAPGVDGFAASPADAARIDPGVDKIGSDWATGVSGAGNSGPGSKSWLDTLLGEIDSKTKVAMVGGGLKAVGEYLGKGKSEKIAAEHYKRQDDISAARLAMDQQKQLNAATSASGLSVKGLLGSPAYQDVPGGYNERRKRNRIIDVTPGA